MTAGVTVVIPTLGRPSLNALLTALAPALCGAGVEVLEFRSSLELPRLVEQEAWAEISRRASMIVSTRDGWRAKNG